MNRVLAFFTPGADGPPLADPSRIDGLYRRCRWQVMIAITLGYGLSYTGRLAMGAVKKPPIDGGLSR